MELNGAEILVDCLQKEGVDHVFGYPGGAVLHIYDALEAQDKITHVLVRHEQGAAHGADGYARTNGKPGVVLVTSGPGITNAVTGIATAHMDSIPMVVISGQVPSPLIGMDAFQEVDATGITRSCVKHKILDIVGDLFLLGGNVIGHYEGFRTGHMLNDQLLSAILSQPNAFSIETFEEDDSPIQFYSEDWQNDL